MHFTTPAMSRSHFVHIAKTINGLKGRLTDEQVLLVAEAFSRSLYSTNASFKPLKFIDACMKQDDKEDTK